MICETGAHHWVPHDAGCGWVGCAHCGIPAVCKGCWGNDPALPDVFCPAHQEMPRSVIFTYRIIAARLVVLAGTVPGHLWHSEAAGEWLSVRVMGIVVVSLWHAAMHNAWRVRVYPPASDVPVFLADGSYPALVVHSARPGPWMMVLRDAVSWRDAIEVESDSELVCGVG